MVNFKNGEIKKKAYVTIGGVDYEVHDATINCETPVSAENLNNMQMELMKLVFPVGSTYVTQDDTNPTELLKFGTWERIKGKVLVGLDENDEAFNQIGKTGGEKTHTLTVDEMPSHSHDVVYANNEKPLQFGGGGSNYGFSWNVSGEDGGAQLTAKNTGGSQVHNNLQPYEVVGYMWIRTA